MNIAVPDGLKNSIMFGLVVKQHTVIGTIVSPSDKVSKMCTPASAVEFEQTPEIKAPPHGKQANTHSKYPVSSNVAILIVLLLKLGFTKYESRNKPNPKGDSLTYQEPNTQTTRAQ